MHLQEMLALSDQDFKRGYIEEIKYWWGQQSTRTASSDIAPSCKECKQALPSFDKVRLYQDSGYCTYCFALLAIHIHHHLDLYNNPEQIIQAEWIAKARRIMDGTLEKVEPPPYIPSINKSS